jgi:hypothetical protein
VIRLTSLIRPPQRSQVSRSRSKVRATSWAHLQYLDLFPALGRLPPATGATGVAPSGAGRGGGATSERYVDAELRTPAYLTVCRRGAGTRPTSRQSRDRGSMSIAVVPSENGRLSSVRQVSRHRTARSRSPAPRCRSRSYPSTRGFDRPVRLGSRRSRPPSPALRSPCSCRCRRARAPSRASPKDPWGHRCALRHGSTS